MKAIITKYHGPTNFHGSKIIASDGDGNRASVHYRSELNSDENHKSAVKALCEKMHWTGILARGDLVKNGRDNAVVWIWLEWGQGWKADRLTIPDPFEIPGVPKGYPMPDGTRIHGRAASLLQADGSYPGQVE